MSKKKSGKKSNELINIGSILIKTTKKIESKGKEKKVL
jgi:hypothetical protein